MHSIPREGNFEISWNTPGATCISHNCASSSFIQIFLDLNSVLQFHKSSVLFSVHQTWNSIKSDKTIYLLNRYFIRKIDEFIKQWGSLKYFVNSHHILLPSSVTSKLTFTETIHSFAGDLWLWSSCLQYILNAYICFESSWTFIIYHIIVFYLWVHNFNKIL